MPCAISGHAEPTKCHGCAERLQEEAAQQGQTNIAMQAQLMHMRSAADDNKRMQEEIERLNKVCASACPLQPHRTRHLLRSVQRS